MTGKSGYHNRKKYICSAIRSLLISLTLEPSKYDEIAPKIEYWIEYVFREDFATVDELVEGVSYVAWEQGGSFESVGKFFKEFRDAPHRSEQARSFVAQFCLFVLRWFAVASTEGVWDYPRIDSGQWLSSGEGPGFLRAASFVGYLIEWGLLSNESVQRHLTKPLTNHHHDNYNDNSPGALRAWAIYNLFIAAGNTLLQGLLESNDVQACFDILDAFPRGKEEPHATKLKEFRNIHATWLQRKEEQTDSRGTEERQGGGEEDTDVVAVDVSAEAKTPVAFIPQDLPASVIGIKIPPSILQDIGSASVLHDTDSPSKAIINIPASSVSSPTSSISTMSDFTPTELGEIEKDQGQVACHDTFYLEDGNVEIVCGDTMFRVHSAIVSFSSPELREILSQSALLNAPTPEGCPRITVSDSAEDFAVLLKMIYAPGFPARHKVPEFSTFGSLLRMTTKYGFSDVHDQLVKDLEGAYPTKWKDLQNAKVLGEDVFGSPRPHPNAVLNLFEAQGVKFAIPFAAYRASTGGFLALMSDKPGAVLPRRTLATTIYGMRILRSMAAHAARMVAYSGDLWVCPDETCTLGVDTNPIKPRLEAMEKIYEAMVDQRKGGELSSPRLEHLLCTKCAKNVAETYAEYGSTCWERLTTVFNVSDCWDDL